MTYQITWAGYPAGASNVGRGNPSLTLVAPTRVIFHAHHKVRLFRLTTSTAKRAETRPCPACSELIPIRLLAAHAELEMQRVEDIIKHIGDAEVLAEVDDLEEG